MSNNPAIEINIGASVKKLDSESPVKFKQDCLPQANFCFYEIDKSFADKNLPSVIINKTLRVDQVVGVTIPIDQDLGEAIEKFKIIVKSIPSNSQHEEYRRFIYDLISEIKKSGWTHYYSPSRVRISDAHYYKISSPDKVFGRSMLHDYWLDPGYEMTANQWLQVRGFYKWNFYKDGNYLALEARRRNSEDKPTERGIYLISLAFRSESGRWRDAFETDEDKKRWKELLPDLLTRYRQERQVLEDRARAAGIEVNTDYQDPPIMALESQ